MQSCSLQLISLTYQLSYSVFLSQQISKQYFSAWLFGRVNREMHSTGDRDLLTSHYYQDDAMQCMAHHHCKLQIAKRLELDVHQHPAEAPSTGGCCVACPPGQPPSIPICFVRALVNLCAFHGSRSFLSLIKMQDTPCILLLLLSSTQLFSSLGHS